MLMPLCLLHVRQDIIYNVHIIAIHDKHENNKSCLKLLRFLRLPSTL